MKSLVCSLLFVASCGAALAAPDVVVTAVRDPVKKSYRKMLDGAALFEKKRQLAPAAQLRFKLIPRTPDTPMAGIELEVAADSVAIPLKVAPDQTFTIERDRTALKENAQVMPNRRAGTMTWRADVRSPGLPPDTRRLGDLRLECEVGMKAGLISNYPAGFFGWLDSLITQKPDYCHRAAPRYLFFAERPIWSVTLVDGERRQALPVDMLYGGATRDPDWKKDRHCDCAALFDRAYFLPLGDTSWPDDTRVEIEYMDSAAPAPLAWPALAVGEWTKSEVQSALGHGTVVDFSSGYEVWVYPLAGEELVLLFEPSGILAKKNLFSP
jgi:hypothetical protein